jgi:hypothetical protein
MRVLILGLLLAVLSRCVMRVSKTRKRPPGGNDLGKEKSAFKGASKIFAPRAGRRTRPLLNRHVSRTS